MADTGMSIQMLIDVWPLVAAAIGTLASMMGMVWRQSRRATLLDVDIKSLKKDCLKIDTMDHRLTVIETRFEPFLAVLEDSISHILPSNPWDPMMVEKIKNGSASAEEMEFCDLELKKELAEKSDDPVKLIMIRYWLALKKRGLLENGPTMVQGRNDENQKGSVS